MGKDPVTIRDYRPSDPIPDVFGHETPAQYDARVDAARAEVTEPVTLPSPWEIARLTEQQWNDLEIPAFLRRTDTTPSEARPAPTKNAPTPPAVGSAGGPSGGSSSTAAAGITGGMFDHFRVDPEEIESKIRHEADRRWRAWVPTKEHLSRPRKSYYEKQVRKEFYP